MDPSFLATLPPWFLAVLVAALWWLLPKLAAAARVETHLCRHDQELGTHEGRLSKLERDDVEQKTELGSISRTLGEVSADVKGLTRGLSEVLGALNGLPAGRRARS